MSVDAFFLVTNEARVCQERLLRMRTTLPNSGPGSGLSWALPTFCVAGVALLAPWLIVTLNGSVALNARTDSRAGVRAGSLDEQNSAVPQAFVTFVTEFEDNAESTTRLGPGVKRTRFGVGASGAIAEAARALAPVIQNCRQFKVAQSASLRLEAKIDLSRPGFRIVGLLDGATENPQMATCVRVKINAARFASLAMLKPVPESDYLLRLEVQSNLGTELPAP